MNIKRPNIVTLPEIDSTNAYLARQIDWEHPKSLACSAALQTHGRGQHERTWVSPRNGNLYYSLLVYSEHPLQHWLGLSLAIGTATVSALTHCGVMNTIRLKWPNDLYHQDSKFGGILVETQTNRTKGTAIIIGIGINLSLNSAHHSVDKPITALDRFCTEPVSASALLTKLHDDCFTCCQLFEQEGLPLFKREWLALDYLKGRMIDCVTPSGVIAGVANGISDQGGLIISDSNNQHRVIMDGSITKVYNHLTHPISKKQKKQKTEQH